MRKEFTAIGAASTVIAFVAGLVLCMQVATTKVELAWEPAWAVLWGIEAAIFGTAVYVWRTRVSLPGWVVGIAGLTLIRLGLTMGGALALAASRENGQLPAAIAQTSGLAPRMCGMLFALMVFYPLRAFLPIRSARTLSRRRFADSAAVKTAMGTAVDSDSELVIWTGSAQKAEGYERAPTAATSMLERSPRRLDIEGTVELPARVVLAQMPPELLNDRMQKIDDSQMMSIPLSAILPQLKEAQVAFRPSEIAEWLPAPARRALVREPDQGDEERSVVLPLALIVPHLAEEALALPPPSPPAWANVDEPQRVVFARI